MISSLDNSKVGIEPSVTSMLLSVNADGLKRVSSVDDSSVSTLQRLLFQSSSRIEIVKLSCNESTTPTALGTVGLMARLGFSVVASPHVSDKLDVESGFSTE